MSRLVCLALASLALAPSPAAGERLGQGRLESTYQQSLRVLAAGDGAGAARLLAELEQHAATADPERGLEVLRRAQVAVARRLARREPEALVPVLLLHREVYDGHVAARRSLPAVHGRLANLAILDIYRERSRHSAAQGLAAAFLTSLGGRLQAGSQERAAAELYRRALQGDRGQVVALVGLGTVREKEGELKAAADLLARAVELAPDGREARLHLAVVESRLGRQEVAAPLLRRLVGEAGGDWVAAVAATELAESLAAAGELRAARAVVDATLARSPCAPSLLVLQGYLAEQDGEGADPSPFVTALGRCAGEPGAAPRTRYNRRPEEPFAALDRELVNAGMERREALARATGVARR
ncbi:MAG TPA: hypothetical protein VMT16_10880 [Thermoanaerobaculia bacterium]|nr:hypothetical protein [Thermoanaerobaculia bacterium]